MVEFKRKGGESFENFLRRFNKGLQRSKNLQVARKKQYFAKPKTKKKQKENALFGLDLFSKNEYLKKTGKLKEVTNRRW